MAQRDGAPPSEWAERRDNETRRTFERFEEKLRDQLEAEINQVVKDTGQRFLQLEREYVTWKGFALFIVPLVTATMALVAVYVSPVKENLSALDQRVGKTEATMSSRLAKQDEKLERQGIDLNALMRVTVDNKPRKQVQKEWESATGVPRIDASP